MDEKVNAIKKWLGTGSINLFGEPFSGKDTQGEQLAKMFSAKLISGGSILRSLKESEEIKQSIGSGNLAPADFYLKSVLPYLGKSEFSNYPLVLSSVGRLEGEEVPTIEAADRSGHTMKAAIWLQLSENEVWKRFDKSKSLNDRGKRQDDTKEALRVRLKRFSSDTIPVLNYYDDHNLLIKIDGSPSTEVVTEKIIDSLYNFMNN